MSYAHGVVGVVVRDAGVGHAAHLLDRGWLGLGKTAFLRPKMPGDESAMAGIDTGAHIRADGSVGAGVGMFEREGDGALGRQLDVLLGVLKDTTKRSPELDDLLDLCRRRAQRRNHVRGARYVGMKEGGKVLELSLIHI